MDIKSKILEEAESNGVNVINLADAMERCPTLRGALLLGEEAASSYNTDGSTLDRGENKRRMLDKVMKRSSEVTENLIRQSFKNPSDSV